MTKVSRVLSLDNLVFSRIVLISNMFLQDVKQEAKSSIISKYCTCIDVLSYFNACPFFCTDMCILDALISGVNHNISDNAISASSVWAYSCCRPSFSRFSSTRGWTPSYRDIYSPWIQVSTC